MVQVLALTLDKFSQGDGYVQETILADVSLRESVEQEGKDFLFFITNKWRILILCALDVVNAKATQRRLQPTPSTDGGDGGGGGEQGGDEIHIEEIQNCDRQYSQNS